MLIDLAVNSFDAEVGDMVALAQAAERAGYGGVWVVDHFSGSIAGARWARDPFVSLGAIGASTSTIGVGLLVANMRNRHPAQLAAAINSVQSLAPGRVVLGLGAGASPGSRFAVEHEAIGTDLGTAEERRNRLVDTIGALRAIWDGGETFVSDSVGYDGLTGVVDSAPCPPIIVGATVWSTVELALRHADGVNVRRTDGLDEVLVRIESVQDRPAGFEVSVLDSFDDVVAQPDRVLDLVGRSVDRLILGISGTRPASDLDAFDLAPQ